MDRAEIKIVRCLIFKQVKWSDVKNKRSGKIFNYPLTFGLDGIILTGTSQPLSLETFEIFHSSSCRAGRERAAETGLPFFRVRDLY